MRSRAGRDQVDKAQQVLAGIAEAHPPPGAALVVAGRAAHVEGDHALVLVPDIDHPVQLFVRAAQAVGGQQVGPVPPEGAKGAVHLLVGGVAGGHRPGAGLVDDAGGLPLFIVGVLDVAQHKDQAAALAGGQHQVDLVRAHRRPAVGDGAGAAPLFHRLGVCIAAVRAQKGVPAGVEAVHRGVHRPDGVVIAALAVFGLVADHAALHLHLAGGEVALEVGGIVHRVPQAELDVAEHLHLFGRCRLVFEGQAVHLAAVPHRHEDLLPGGQAVFGAL